MKWRKRALLFIAFTGLFVCINVIEKTYAKYVTNATLDTDVTLARWNILVDNTDITSNSDFEKKITPTFIDNDYIKYGVLAPTSKAYFDIDVDATNTDVSFDYEISVTPSENNTITDLSITKVLVNDEEINDVTETVTGSILYNDVVRRLSFKIYIEWNDDAETETMDNAADVDAIQNGDASYVVSVRFVQKHD